MIRNVADAARQIYARTFVRFPKLADVFVNAGIDSRYSARSLEWLSAPHDFAERTDAYVESASELFMRSARRALDRAGISPREVDVVVTVSSTGIATPGIEARVGPEMGFRSAVMRVPVFGRGCAGGVSGLALGARLARADPGEVVLVVVVELCTLASRPDRGTKSDVISSALFGDGAAAAVLRAEKGTGGLRVGAAAEHTWPHTLDIMGWAIDPIGFRVMLSRSLPRFVEERMAAPVRRFIKAARLEAPKLICHPGGAKVLDAIEVALELQKGTLRDERDIAGTATCRHRPFFSSSSAYCSADCAGPPCFQLSGPDSPRTFSRSRPHMGEGAWLVAFLVVQRLIELVFAQTNTGRLRLKGAVEFGAAHYPLVIALHASWLLGLWLLGHDRPIAPFWLAVFIGLQVGRAWVIASLGRRWTTRVIVLQGAAPVASGPYRLLRHPNYLVVALEIAVVPLALGLPVFALVFSIANAALLFYRIRIENEALAWAGRVA